MIYLKKRALGIGLGLLTVALWVGPIFMAFQTNNWNLKRTLLPSQEGIGGVQSKMRDITGTPISENSFSLVRQDISEEEISQTIAFTSPLEPNMKPLDTISIERMKLKLSDETQGTEIVILELEEPVEVGPDETKSIVLSGTPTPKGRDIIANIDNPARLQELIRSLKISGGIVEVKIAGIRLEISPKRLMEDIG